MIKWLKQGIQRSGWNLPEDKSHISNYGKYLMFEHALHTSTYSWKYTCLHFKFPLMTWNILSRWVRNFACMALRVHNISIEKNIRSCKLQPCDFFITCSGYTGSKNSLTEYGGNRSGNAQTVPGPEWNQKHSLSFLIAKIYTKIFIIFDESHSITCINCLSWRKCSAHDDHYCFQ